MFSRHHLLIHLHFYNIVKSEFNPVCNSYSLTSSTFPFGFQHFTPINPPMPDTTIITAKVKRYDKVILKNSIKFAIKAYLPICLKSFIYKMTDAFIFTEHYNIMIPSYLQNSQAVNLEDSALFLCSHFPTHKPHRKNNRLYKICVLSYNFMFNQP